MNVVMSTDRHCNVVSACTFLIHCLVALNYERV